MLVAVLASAFGGLPLPGNASLRGTVEANGIHEVPELVGARQNRLRDQSVANVHAIDQTWETDVAYRDAVRFYDTQLATWDVLARDKARTATGWLVRNRDDGSLTSVTIRNTRPTTIEIQHTIP